MKLWTVVFKTMALKDTLGESVYSVRAGTRDEAIQEARNVHALYTERRRREAGNGKNEKLTGKIYSVLEVVPWPLAS